MHKKQQFAKSRGQKFKTNHLEENYEFWNDLNHDLIFYRHSKDPRSSCPIFCSGTLVQDEEVDEEKNLHDEQRTDLTLLPIINYRENNSLPKDLEGRVIDMNIPERTKNFEMKDGFLTKDGFCCCWMWYIL